MAEAKFLLPWLTNNKLQEQFKMQDTFAVACGSIFYFRAGTNF